MVVSNGGGAARDAARGTEDPGRPEAEPGPAGSGGGTRRAVLRRLLATAALTPLVAASSRPAAARTPGRAARPAPHPHGHTHGHGHPGPPDAAHPRDTEYPRDPAYRVQDLVFDETYRGRRIRGFRTPGGRGAHTGQWHVTVDGRPLHVMRRADGTWLTMVDHYHSYATPLEAARGAVDEMTPGSRLRDTGRGPRHEEGHHGVHP